MIGCEECREALSPYIDGELAPEQREELDVHIESCVDCRDQLERMRALSRALFTLPQVETSPQFEAAFWSRLERESAEDRPVVSLREPQRLANGLLHWLGERWPKPPSFGLGLATAGACAVAAVLAFRGVGDSQPDWLLAVDADSYELLQEEELDLLEVMEILEAWDGSEGA